MILSVCSINAQYVYNPLSPPNYCINQTQTCQFQGLTHFACNNSGAFASTCPTGREVVPMTTTRINLILNLHNSLRNTVALGKQTGCLNGATLPPASRMATIRWSQELADLALLNVKQCQMKHDACHNTAEFKFSGQNLAISSNSRIFKDPDVVIDGLTRAWFNQYKSANSSNIDKCCFSYSR